MKKCILFALLVVLNYYPAQAYATSDTVLHIALDTSGSMRYKTKWISDTIFSLKEEAHENSELTSSISLQSFTDKIDMSLEGDDKRIITSINAIKFRGSIEDGFIPINRIADKVNDGGHILLVTDEGRDQIIDVSVDDLLEVIIRKNITVHAIIKHKMECGGNEVIGINSDLKGITDKFNYVNCGSPVNLESRNSDYIKLSLGSGGHIWNLGKIISHKSNYGKFLAQELLEKYGIPFFKAYTHTNGVHSAGSPITFDASNTISEDSAGPVTSWAWDFDSDGRFDDYGAVVAHVFEESGIHKVMLMLSNEQSPSVTQKQIIRVVIDE